MTKRRVVLVAVTVSVWWWSVRTAYWTGKVDGIIAMARSQADAIRGRVR